MGGAAVLLPHPGGCRLIPAPTSQLLALAPASNFRMQLAREMFKSREGLTSHQGATSCKGLGIFKAKAGKLDWWGGRCVSLAAVRAVRTAAPCTSVTASVKPSLLQPPFQNNPN